MLGYTIDDLTISLMKGHYARAAAALILFLRIQAILLADFYAVLLVLHIIAIPPLCLSPFYLLKRMLKKLKVVFTTVKAIFSYAIRTNFTFALFGAILNISAIKARLVQQFP